MYDYQERKRRSDAGILQLTERDVTVLIWIAEQYCISFDQLRRLLGRYAKATTKREGILSISATREAIERWLQMELIEPPRKLLASHAPYIWLSRRGLAQLGLPYAYYQPKLSMIHHIYSLNAVRLYLEKTLPVIWYSTRILVRMTNNRPTPDAELHAGAAIIAVQVMEKSRLPALSVKEAISTLQLLAQRNYSYFWYFLHMETIPLFQQALLPLDQELRERVLFYALDAQEEEARAHLNTIAQQSAQDGTV